MITLEVEVEVVVEQGTVGVGKDSYTQKKISLMNPKPRNIMAEIHSEFSRQDVKMAKVEWRTSQLEGQLKNMK